MTDRHAPPATPRSAPRSLACIGLGANLGDGRRSLREAVAEIDALPDTRVAVVSSHYRSAPVDASGPDFINAVAVVETALDPFALLEALQRIETAHGRERPFVNAPRTLDLDLLLWGDARIHTATLQVPHPRLHRRAFALAPLAEVLPGARVPGHGVVADLLTAVADQRVERLAEAGG